nr:hypothetical protein [Sinorhizobium medicae]
MPPRLLKNALPAVDEDDGKIRRRSAGHHVARIFFVTGRVGNDELALRRREIAVGDVDGDPLFALGLEPVEKQSEIDFLAIGTTGRADTSEVCELVLEDQFRIIEQPADQGGFAVVDRTACDESQDRLVVVLNQMRFNVMRRYGLNI